MRNEQRTFNSPIINMIVVFYFALMILSIGLYGCPYIIPLHKPGPEPFPVYKKDFAIVGYTTKDRVVEKLGNPSTSRLSGRMYIYAGGQKDWDLHGGVFIIYYGIAGFGGSISTYKTHLLIFEFDKNDVVTAVHTFSGDKGELESGIYVVDSGGYIGLNKMETKPWFQQNWLSGVNVNAEREWRYAIKNLILRAPKHMDQLSKQFVPPSDKAVIYYYKIFSDNFEVALDDDLSVDTGIDGYLMWVVDPGDHTVICPWCVGNLKITCCAGEKLYLEHGSDMIRVKEKSVGEEEISKRTLVIDRLNTFDFDRSEYHKDLDSF